MRLSEQTGICRRRRRKRQNPPEMMGQNTDCHPCAKNEERLRRRPWEIERNHNNVRKKNLINEVCTDTCTFPQGGGEWLHHNAVAVNELNLGCSHTLPVCSGSVWNKWKKQLADFVVIQMIIEYHETECILGFYLFLFWKKRDDTCRSLGRLMRTLEVQAEWFTEPECRLSSPNKLTGGILPCICSNPIVLFLDWLRVESVTAPRPSASNIQRQLLYIFVENFVALIVCFAGWTLGEWHNLIRLHRPRLQQSRVDVLCLITESGESLIK